MKKLLTILLLSLTLTVSAKVPQWLKTTGLYTTSIVFNAVGDGLNDNGQKTLGHAFDAASIGILVASPFILNAKKSDWPFYVASYVTLRFALFDPTYNMTRGLPMEYTGDSSLTDKFWVKLSPPVGGQTFMRAIILTMSISFAVNNIGE